MKFRTGSLLFVCMIGGFNLTGQGISDSTFIKKSINNALALYSGTVRQQAQLFSGTEYLEFDNLKVNHHPFFQSEEWEAGTISYLNKVYHNVPMRYDLAKDQLILEYYDQEGIPANLKLEEEKVNYFTVHNLTFIRISKNQLSGAVNKSGYYNLLYDGTTRVLAKRRKIRSEEVTEVIETSFQLKVNYFIRKDDKYYEIRNKGSVFSVLKDKKKELHEFINVHNLNFKKQREEFLIQVASHYDQLKTKS